MSSSVLVPSACCLLPEHIRGLLVHVDAEEVSLRNTMSLLRDMPLQSVEESARREMRVRIEQSLQHGAFLAQNRTRVLAALGERVAIPKEHLSFSALLPFATPAARALLIPARQRLQRIVRQVQVLVHSAAWIINESRRVHLMVFESLPGATSSDRYDATGQKNLNPSTFRFETRS